MALLAWTDLYAFGHFRCRAALHAMGTGPSCTQPYSLNDICSRLLWIFRSWTRRWYKRGKKTSEWSLWRSLSSAPNCCPTSPSSSSIHPSSSSSPIFSIPSDDLFMIELSTRRLWWPVQRLAVPGTLPKYWLPTRWIYGRGLEVFYQQHSQHSLLGM